MDRNQVHDKKRAIIVEIKRVRKDIPEMQLQKLEEFTFQDLRKILYYGTAQININVRRLEFAVHETSSMHVG